MTDEHGFQGKAVMITGGTSGIGFSIAKQLARKGARLVVTGRSPERGEQAAALLRELSAEALYVKSDSNNAESAAAGVSKAEEFLGGIDVLVSAGAEGVVRPTLFTEMTGEQLQADFSARFFSRIFPVHAAIPILRAGGGGAIVLITTDAARHATPGESIIGASGASIMLMTKVLAQEFARWSIRVNAVALTLTSDTPSWDRIFSRESFANRLFSKALTRFPSGRAPTADEVSHAAIFLASEQASQITGQTLSVNGGLSFGGW